MKLKVQQRWIEDLTEQTQMMARFVRELEDEATNRVQMLEDKLKQTSKSAYEVRICALFTNMSMAKQMTKGQEIQ